MLRRTLGERLKRNQFHTYCKMIHTTDGVMLQTMTYLIALEDIFLKP